jgi:hypothetical protein
LEKAEFSAAKKSTGKKLSFRLQKKSTGKKLIGNAGVA